MILFGYLTGKTAKLLENRFILYFVFIIALINIYVLLLNNHFNGLSVFFLTGIIVSAFNKNMIVILLTSIILTNVVKETAPTFYEGFSEGVDDVDGDGDGGNDDQKKSKSLTEDVSNAINELNGGSGKKSEKEIKDLNEMTSQYSELIDIQKGLLDGIKKVAEPLEKAEKIIEKLANKVEGMRNGK
jgi:hypothetical protein